MQFLTFVLLPLVCLVQPQAQVAAPGFGEISLPKGYLLARAGITDSWMGEVRKADGALTIHFDIGAMAGSQMSPERRKECVWYEERLINGRRAFLGLVKKRAVKEFIVTITGDTKEPWCLPANFWAEVRSKRDITAVRLIAAGYKPKHTG
jgi:hypothetical protein